jgi:hypothetical protein
MVRVSAICIVGGLILTGCVPPQPLAGGAHLSVSDGGAKFTLADTKIVQVNTPMKLNFVFAALTPTCDLSTEPPPVVTVVAPPAHGTVNVVNNYGYPTFSPNSPLSKCNTVRIPGQEIVYTPATNYAGPDFTSVKLYFSDGKELINNTTFDVGG